MSRPHEWRIYESANQTIIGSDKGLSPGRRQAIIWTNAGILSIGPLGINFSHISMEIQPFSFIKMRLKSSSVKWQPSCLGLNVLTHWLQQNGQHFFTRHVQIQVLELNFLCFDSIFAKLIFDWQLWGISSNDGFEPIRQQAITWIKADPVLPIHMYIARHPSHLWYFNRIQNSMKLCNALVHNTFGQSQWNFARHDSSTVQHFIVISRAHFKPEHSKFWLNFEFGRNIVNGLDTVTYRSTEKWLSIQKYIFQICF